MIAPGRAGDSSWEHACIATDNVDIEDGRDGRIADGECCTGLSVHDALPQRQ
jgi:hypothetical protein